MIKCSYCDRQCRNFYCHKCGKITNGSQKDHEKGHLDFFGVLKIDRRNNDNYRDEIRLKPQGSMYVG